LQSLARSARGKPRIGTDRDGLRGTGTEELKWESRRDWGRPTRSRLAGSVECVNGDFCGNYFESTGKEPGGDKPASAPLRASRPCPESTRGYAGGALGFGGEDYGVLVKAADVAARGFDGGLDAFGKGELPVFEQALDAIGHAGFGQVIRCAARDKA